MKGDFQRQTPSNTATLFVKTTVQCKLKRDVRGSKDGGHIERLRYNAKSLLLFNRKPDLYSNAVVPIRFNRVVIFFFQSLIKNNISAFSF
jgi:hypothetical protein